jgi:AraC-like DNA-binding protein
MNVDLHNIAVYIRYSVYRKCPETDWAINTRTIPDHEFVLITEGSGIIAIEGKEHKAKAGAFFHFYPTLVHALKSCNENPMSFLAVHFSFANIHYENNNWKLEDEEPLMPFPPVLEIKNYIKLKKIMIEINKHWQNKDIGYELMCNGLFLQLLNGILQDYRLNNYNYSSHVKVEEIISYIYSNLDKKLSIKTLADVVKLSPDYMSKIFKQITGYSLVRYINKCRVDVAKKMLLEDGMKVKEVAGMLSFKDEFYFSRVFKNIEGVSPMEFLKKSM